MTDKEQFIYKCVCKIPGVYRSILFLTARKVRSWAGARMCGIQNNQFRMKRKALFRYLEYLKYYYDNRKVIDEIIERQLVKRDTARKLKYKIFNKLLLNPFIPAQDIAKQYNISISTTRVVVHHAIKAFETNTNKNDVWAMAPLIRKFREVVFGYYKEQGFICRE